MTDIPVEVKRAIFVIGVLTLTVIVAKVLRTVMNQFLKKSSKHMRIDPTKYIFTKHVISGLVYCIGIAVAIYMIPPLKAFSVSILAGAGVLAVIIGFASQQAFSNIISGVFIAIFRPFKVGDRIKIKDTIAGVIEDITLRHTVIRNYENKRIIIPNSVISTEVIENANFEENRVCKFVEFGISYDSDVEKAIEIIRKEAENHTTCMDNRSKDEIAKGVPKVDVRVTGFSDSAVLLRAWVWAAEPKAAYYMGCDLNKSIKQRFDKEGIEIPFPHRTIVYKK